MNLDPTDFAALSPDELRDIDGGDLIDALLRELAERALEAAKELLRPRLPQF